MRELLLPLNDPESEIAVSAERAFLAGLDGSCRTPIAALARLKSGKITFHGMILTPDGSQWHECKLDGDTADAIDIGRDAAGHVRQKAGSSFFESW